MPGSDSIRAWMRWLVPATLASLGLATLNAWVLLVEVIR
jgi:hypothetical protein